MDNTERLATLCTQDEDKQNKNATLKTKTRSNTDPRHVTYIVNMCWTPICANLHKERK